MQASGSGPRGNKVDPGTLQTAENNLRTRRGRRERSVGGRDEKSIALAATPLEKEGLATLGRGTALRQNSWGNGEFE